MQIFNHGITAAALFYFVGLLEQRRGAARHQRFRRPDATHAVALRLDERGHVFLVRPARTERIHRRISHLQRFLRPRRCLSPRSPCSAFSSPRLFSCARCKRSSAVRSRRVAAHFPILRLSEKWVIVPVTLLMFAIGICAAISSSTSSTPPSCRWRGCLARHRNEQRDHSDWRKSRSRFISCADKKCCSIVDLATLYGVSTKALNQAVKRNRRPLSRGFHVSTQRAGDAEILKCHNL